MNVDGVKQKASPFLKIIKSWENEDFHISPEILKGILDELNFLRPSQIQAVAIPLIVKTDSDHQFVNLIAQSKNGSGKTGAYSIGSTMRVDPQI